MSNGLLFKNLTAIVGGKDPKGEEEHTPVICKTRLEGISSTGEFGVLNPAQIALMVRDVARAANKPSGADEYDSVSMDEFCYLTGDI